MYQSSSSTAQSAQTVRSESRPPKSALRTTIPTAPSGCAPRARGSAKSGFYRLVVSCPDHIYARNFTTLHELFHVYEDRTGVLRTDHTISFLGMTIGRLH
jgi:hypothetical protein